MSEVENLRQDVERLRTFGLLSALILEDIVESLKSHTSQLHLARQHANLTTEMLVEQASNTVLLQALYSVTLERVERVESKLDAYIAWVEQLTKRVDAHDAALECVQKRTACKENTNEANGNAVQVTG